MSFGLDGLFLLGFSLYGRDGHILQVAILSFSGRTLVFPKEYRSYRAYVCSPYLDYFLTGKSHQPTLGKRTGPAIPLVSSDKSVSKTEI